MPAARLRLVLFAAVTVLLVAVVALRDRDENASSQEEPTSTTGAPGSSERTAAASDTSVAPETTPTTVATPPTVGLPAAGDGGGVTPTGELVLAPGSSAQVGGGPLRTYAVQVENGIPIAPADFAAEVDRILADPRGWTADGSRSLQRVEDPAAASFTVVLATPATTDELCAPLRTNGIFSCFQDGRSVINLDRWNLGAEAQSGLPLPEYRNYVVSHEVGHALGFGHVGCPAPSWPAPVMMQQTKGIDGCAPNPWPFP